MNCSAIAAPVCRGLVVSDVASRLASLLASAGLDDLVGAAQTEVQHGTDAVCTVAVVGEFKRGKSTLINALIEADLLPVGAVPLTAVGTYAEFGEVVRVAVEYLDGRCVEVTPNAIAEYATERGNPGNERGVAAVNLTTPAPVLRSIRLVDTPGVGSAFADATETARELLGHADFAVAVLSAEQPASRRELKFVRELISGGMPTFVVTNKLDLVPAAERSEVVEFARAQLGGASTVHLFALSAEQARCAQRVGDQAALRASGVPALEEALTGFVRRDGSRAVARGCRRRLLGLVDSALAQLELRRQAGPVTRQWQKQRCAALQRRVDIALFCDMRDANQHILAAARDLIRELAVVASESVLVHQLESKVESLPPWRRGQSVRNWATGVETYIAQVRAAVINCWSAAEEQALAVSSMELTEEWSKCALELLGPILGDFEAPVPPAIEFMLPAVPLPPEPLTAPILLPGVLGRWQVRRRVWRRMRETLPSTLQARRLAIDTRVTAAVRQAAEQYREALEEMARRIIAQATPEHSPSVAAPDTITSELHALRTALIEGDNDL
jgi:small GTP-binding protein